MRVNLMKERLREVKAADESTGLYSRYLSRMVDIFPVGRTLETMGKFLGGDLVRWETWDKARRNVECRMKNVECRMKNVECRMQNEE